MITVSISPKYALSLQPDIIEQAAQTVLDMESNAPNSELTILIDSDMEIQKLNHQFLGIDAPTDVLSFPSNETDPETQLPYLGDIIISYPRALAQAEAAGESVSDELQLLVVHGVLHLLGFDHAGPDEKAEMWAVQQAVLNSLGCKISHLPE